MKHRNIWGFFSPQNTKKIQIHLNSRGEQKCQNYHKINRNTHKTNTRMLWVIESHTSGTSVVKIKTHQ